MEGFGAHFERKWLFNPHDGFQFNSRFHSWKSSRGEKFFARIGITAKQRGGKNARRRARVKSFLLFFILSTRGTWHLLHSGQKSLEKVSFYNFERKPKLTSEFGLSFFPLKFKWYFLCEFSNTVGKQQFLSTTTRKDKLHRTYFRNDDPTKVIREHLHSMLHGPFNLVRHHELEQQKSNIAVYIWQKLGLFSTFNCVQKFVAKEEQNVRFSFHYKKLKTGGGVSRGSSKSTTVKPSVQFLSKLFNAFRTRRALLHYK